MRKDLPFQRQRNEMVERQLRARGIRDERVLEIGTGSGYQTAILAELAAEVVSVERIEPLSQAAEQRLLDLGYRNILFRRGDGTLGCPEDAPYDRILVTAGAPSLPQGLVSQLAEDGKLVAPVGGRDMQTLVRCDLTKRGTETENLCSCVFVPLVGEHGWKQGS